MEWVKADSLIIDKEKKLTMTQLDKKQIELERIGLDNAPPIWIDDKNRILDGVKRFLVLRKCGYQLIPVCRTNENYEVFVNTISNDNNLKIAA